MATPEQVLPKWLLSTDDEAAPVEIRVRPSHHKNARDMMPYVLDILSGFMASEHGSQLLDDGGAFFKAMEQGAPEVSESEGSAATEEGSFDFIKKHLPAISRIIHVVTGPGRDVWRFIEDQALPALTTLDAVEHQDAGTLTERIALAAGALTWHYNQNNRPDTRAALGKSLSATSEALSKTEKSEVLETPTTA